MKSKGILLKVVTIAMTVYFIASIPYFLTEGSSSLEGHPVIGALYLLFIGVHEGLVLIALLCQWAGLLKKSRGLITFAIIFMVLAGIELILLVYPALILLVLVILDVIARVPKESLQ